MNANEMMNEVFSAYYRNTCELYGMVEALRQEQHGERSVWDLGTDSQPERIQILHSQVDQLTRVCSEFYQIIRFCKAKPAYEEFVLREILHHSDDEISRMSSLPDFRSLRSTFYHTHANI